MNITQSLFGITPQDVQAQRQAELDKRAASFAQLSPIQQAQSGFYRAGSMFGDAAAGVLGYEDPQVAQARQRQGMLGGLNLNDPESLLQAAQGLQGTDPEAALYLSGQAQAIQEKQAGMDTKQRALQNRYRALKSRFPDMPEAEAEALAADEVAFRKLFEEQQAKLSSFGQQLVDAGFVPGSPEFQTQMQKFINNELTPKKSIGDQIADGLGPLVGAIASGQAKRAGETAGAEVGKATATIQGKDDALIALQNASKLLKDSKGKYAIYSGFYGPSVTSAVKATGGFVGDRQKVVQTEKFLNEVRTTVIPLLAEFGGNDSNEELKFLQGIVGGDQTLEPESIDAILKSAQAKISRGIKRVQDQQSAVVQGNPLPTNTTSQGQPQTRRTSSGVTYMVVPQ